jgi:hypothetical protein
MFLLAGSAAMSNSYNYAQCAQECLRAATDSSDLTEKQLLLEMADAWIHVGLAQADVFNDPDARRLIPRIQN